ncbi:methyl-accepting chemotaxis protein [Sporomusa acidovorans]|uniref:Methyl-accepting transducer domain-containing protein n=1 Tax=Sporomusa acidovorans (strain ATCC 49682 / DSM 3132 / Mol) TaxID=1123286 RepID=A0ABZ3J7U6_SPOA4|nr:methyl-accepting chemotaxis protein [Sporomusa acidovorans]OZC16734.1 putative sensory transducer protein YfmS [Sporomusa acidovorans DSM 3132]SDE04226.1 Methyl-accepting chemotaxis protein (MCP) signalling domain-containing protein [Sporomusa acidovorans]
MQPNDLRVHPKELEFLKQYWDIMLPSYEDGACFFVTDLNTVTFKSKHKFDIPGLDVGTQYSQNGVAAQVIQARRIHTLQIDRNVYGVRVFAIGGPVWNDSDSEILGAWVLAMPRQHKLVNAFDSFAPVLADLLPEGGVLYVADKEKIIKRQASKKFDIPEMQVNTPLPNESIAIQSQKQKKLIAQEMDASFYGLPTMVTASPLIVESGEIVGSFGLTLPRHLANDLKGIASSLDQGLSGVSASVQQITAATNDVSGSQSHLHEEIQRVKEHLENINKVMGFIKEIADETKMLGLNAAIEAARVGEAGRGFGVVAEEIRKLSEESKKTVSQIRDLTGQIDKSVTETSSASESTLAVVEETSAAIQEVNATIEELTSIAGKLTQTAAKL